MQNPVELLPEQVRAYREALGLSQSALAVNLGSSERTIQDWEAGRRRPPAMLQLALAALWDRPPLDLGQLVARANAKAWMASAGSVLHQQAMMPLHQIPDDQLFAWATNIQVNAASYFSAAAALNSYTGSVGYQTNLLGR